MEFKVQLSQSPQCVTYMSAHVILGYLPPTSAILQAAGLLGYLRDGEHSSMFWPDQLPQKPSQLCEILRHYAWTLSGNVTYRKSNIRATCLQPHVTAC